MTLSGLSTLLFNASLPFATIALLAFILYSWWREAKVFGIATLASLAAFVCLSLLLPLLFVQDGMAMVFKTAAREIFYAWTIMAVYFVAEFRYRIRLLGVILMPAALVMLFLSTFETESPVAGFQLRGVPTILHMGLVLASFALLFLAAATAALYLYKSGALKRKATAALNGELPAVTTLKRLMTGAYQTAFALLTLGLVLGTLYAGTALKPGWYTSPFIVMVALLWCLQATIFYLSLSGRWESLRVARAIVVLFALTAMLTAFSRHRDMLHDAARQPAPPAQELSP
jgi:ABC-type uncharacterized transport system permease subunit